MARWFLLAGAAGVLGVGTYFLATGESQMIGGGTVAAALFLAAAAGWRSRKQNAKAAEPDAASDQGRM